MTALPQAIFFDFDGVILESVSVKTEAFGRLFEDRGAEVREAVVAYHLAHGGVSRYDKFRYYYDQILQEPLTDATFDQLCRDFERLVYEGVVAAPFVPGAEAFLKQYADAIKCFVVSGTPHDEINRIVDERGLWSHFVSVHGSPTSKGDWVAQLLQQHDLQPEATLFVGDAPSDWKGATENGVPFVGRVPEGAENPFAQRACAALITDLTDLDRVAASVILTGMSHL